MKLTMTRHLPLLACLAAPLAACAPVVAEPDEPDDPTDPTDPGMPQSYALQALHFTGTQASRAHVVSTATDRITLEAWVRWDGGAGLQAIAYNGDSSTSGYGLYVQNGLPRVLVAGKGFIKCTSCVLAPGSWSHLAAVRSGGTWAIYQDGAAGALEGTPTLAPATPAGAFAIGSSPSGGEGWNGAIDEVRIWEVARSAQELAQDRTAALAGTEAGLVAYYRLDEGTGDLARDATINHRDLDLAGAPMWIPSGATLTSRR